MRAALELLAKVTSSTRTGEDITTADIRPLLAAGATRAQVEDALYVGFCFNIITRLADTFEFWVGPPESFAASAKMLLTRGYNL